MSEELTTLLDQLKDERAQAAYMRDQKRLMIEEVQNSKPYMFADSCQQKHDENITRLEAKIRQMALDLHGVGAELPERVDVKKFTVVNEYDKTAAREWCFINFRPALILDSKTFDKAVKDGNIPADIATVGNEYRAQIATKL